MSERSDEVTTSESFGSRRRGTAPAVEPTSTSSGEVTVDDDAAKPPPIDVSAIEASVATIREHATGLPNSDALAAVLAAVERIEAALPIIAQGFADITASLEATPAPSE